MVVNSLEKRIPEDFPTFLLRDTGNGQNYLLSSPPTRPNSIITSTKEKMAKTFFFSLSDEWFSSLQPVYLEL